MEHRDDALSVEEAAATYEERNRRLRRVTGYVVATGAAVIAAVVALGVAGLEPID
ncbi:hypothetical protein [Mumia sp. DW29H23]|uniref:hypothetical protein n=1 Tax=Mumia sp. DW29H23 TaxID=3421241 RepID=UPI003D695775